MINAYPDMSTFPISRAQCLHPNILATKMSSILSPQEILYLSARLKPESQETR
jgi:hypothetical protein